MSNTEAENIYAPPSTDVTVKESDTTSYLEHDGYSERGMFLCNEHFQPPRTCLKTGEPMGEQEQFLTLCVARYLPSIKDSASVKRAWIVRITLILLAAVVMNQLATLFLLVVFLVAHRFLNFTSSEKIILKVHVKPEYLQKRKISQIGCILVATAAAIYLSYQLINFTEKLPILISVVVLIMSLRTALSLTSLLKFIRKKGDYYYLKGAHPYFLADLPLRS